jgi:predicted PurR-regulated permease PerM
MPQRGPLIFLAVALVALLPFLTLVAWPFLTSFILASILAVVMSLVNDWLIGRIHRPGLATFLTTLATVLAVGIVDVLATRLAC